LSHNSNRDLFCNNVNFVYILFWTNSANLYSDIRALIDSVMPNEHLNQDLNFAMQK